MTDVHKDLFSAHTKGQARNSMLSLYCTVFEAKSLALIVMRKRKNGHKLKEWTQT
jgi:hypothetical protein